MEDDVDVLVEEEGGNAEDGASSFGNFTHAIQGVA
jgi:hypothetical protein